MAFAVGYRKSQLRLLREDLNDSIAPDRNVRVAVRVRQKGPEAPGSPHATQQQTTLLFCSSTFSGNVQNSTAAEKQTPFLQEMLTVPELMVNLAVGARNMSLKKRCIAVRRSQRYSDSEVTETWFGTGRTSPEMIANSLFSTV